MDDFVSENLLNLNFDSTDLQFSTLYYKLVKFLRNREITGVPRKIADPKDSALFSTEVFYSDLNKALQKRENNRRQQDYKEKKLMERNHNRNQDFQKHGRGGPMKRKIWFCSIHGNQTDHSSEWCSTLHPDFCCWMSWLRLSAWASKNSEALPCTVLLFWSSQEGGGAIRTTTLFWLNRLIWISVGL